VIGGAFSLQTNPHVGHRSVRSYSSHGKGESVLSPAVGYLYRLHNISEDEKIEGSGRNGKVLKGDVLRYLGLIAGSKSQRPTKQETSSKEPSKSTQPQSRSPSSSQQEFANPKSNVPHVWFSIDVPTNEVTDALKTLNMIASKQSLQLSMQDVVTKACALALRDVPDANTYWGGDDVNRFDAINLAIQTNTPKGSVTSLIKDADDKGLLDIARATKEAPSGSNDYGSMVISKVDVDDLSLVIPKGFGGILAIGKERREIVLDELDRPSISAMTTFTLSMDQRAMPSETAAKFLDTFSRYLSNPALLS